MAGNIFVHTTQTLYTILSRNILFPWQAFVKGYFLPSCFQTSTYEIGENLLGIYTRTGIIRYFPFRLTMKGFSLSHFHLNLFFPLQERLRFWSCFYPCTWRCPPLSGVLPLRRPVQGKLQSLW